MTESFDNTQMKTTDPSYYKAMKYRQFLEKEIEKHDCTKEQINEVINRLSDVACRDDIIDVINSVKKQSGEEVSNSVPDASLESTSDSEVLSDTTPEDVMHGGAVQLTHEQKVYRETKYKKKIMRLITEMRSNGYADSEILRMMHTE